MEKIARPSKLTIDTTDAPNYGGATVPPMGWSSWNTFRQNINQDLILEVAEAMEASGLAEALRLIPGDVPHGLALEASERDIAPALHGAELAEVAGLD